MQRASSTHIVPHAHRRMRTPTLQVHIVYGTEDTSNAELLSHYGFVDRGASAAEPNPDPNPNPNRALTLTPTSPSPSP